MTYPRFSFGAAATLAAIFFAGTALAAPDAKAVADALVAAATAAGATASYDSAAASGEDVVVTNFRTTQRGKTLTVPSFVVAAPTPRPEGGFISPRLSFDSAASAGDSGGPSMTWQTGFAEDAILPTPDEIKTRAAIRPFRTVRIAGISVIRGAGQPPVTIADFSGDFGEVQAGAPRGFSVRLGPIKASIDTLSDMPNYRRVLELLGYKEFTANVTAEGGYDDKTDTLTLAALGIDTADVGKVTISGKFSGMSLGQIATRADSVGTTAQAKLDSFRLDFANGGIIERIVAMQAEATGSTPAEVVEQATAAVSVTFMLAGNIDFAEKITTAMNTFLADPKTLSFRAAPPAPVSLGRIFAAAIGARETLPDLLAVDIRVNE